MMTLIERDLKNFFRLTYWIAILIVSNLADLLIIASSLGNIIVGMNYLQFFGPGITLVSAFASSFIMARKINMEKENQFDYYLLSLPIKRLNFVLGRAIAGALQGFIYSLPLLITTFLIIRIPNVWEITIIILLILAFSLAMSCFAMILATKIRSSRNFTLARSFIYMWLMFGSTIFYPLDAISSLPSQVILILQVNPMSFGVNILRSILFQNPINFLDVIGLIIFVILIVILGIYAYDTV